MKNIYVKSLLSISAAAAVLTGCGGDSSDPVTTANTTTGYFIDAPVAGAEYNTSSGISGTTDAYGRFKFEERDRVEFRIGKILLGTAKPVIEDDGVGIVTPKELADDNTTQTLILQLLQALDSDGNVTNGITISSETLQTLEELNTTIDIHKVKSEENLLAVEPLAELVDKDYDGHIDVDPNQAHKHFQMSLEKWNEGKRPEVKTQIGVNTTKGKGNGQGKGNAQGQGGQGNHGQNAQGSNTQTNTNGFDLTALPVTENLTQSLKDEIAFMGNEERLAYDVYTYLYNYHLANSETAIKQLTNIATRSETKHIATVRDLVKRYNLTADDLTNLDTDNAPVAGPNTAQESLPAGVYDIEHIQELYNSLIEKGTQSVQDALEVGCMVEVTDINDLDPKVADANASGAVDIQAAFEFLRKGSYNHYWAFDKGLKNMGVEDGCCSLGDEWCHPEYPQNEKGNH